MYVCFLYIYVEKAQKRGFLGFFLCARLRFFRKIDCYINRFPSVTYARIQGRNSQNFFLLQHSQKLRILIAHISTQRNNMTNHTYTPNPNDELSNHIEAVPSGFVSLGTYARSDNVHGAVLKNTTDGSLWFRTQEGSIRIDGRMLKKTPGKVISIYIDSSTTAAARKIGNGNLSAGIRKAVATFAQLPDFLKG